MLAGGFEIVTVLGLALLSAVGAFLMLRARRRA